MLAAPGEYGGQKPQDMQSGTLYVVGLFPISPGGFQSKYWREKPRALVGGGEMELLMSARAVCSCQGLHLGGLIFPEAKRMGFYQTVTCLREGKEEAPDSSGHPASPPHINRTWNVLMEVSLQGTQKAGNPTTGPQTMMPFPTPPHCPAAKGPFITAPFIWCESNNQTPQCVWNY